MTIDAAIAAPDRSRVPSWVGRRPIYDRDLKVRAWELLCGGAEEGTEGAEAESFWREFLDLGRDDTPTGQPTLIPISRSFLQAGAAEGFAGESVAFEVPAAIAGDDAGIEALRGLARRGFRIVLDGLPRSEEADAILAVASAIRLEAGTEASRGELAANVERLHEQGVQVVACGIGSLETFERCRGLGADRFQGPFLLRPDPRASTDLPVDALSGVKILSLVNDPNVSLDEFEAAISQDLGLSYKLLRYMNSPMFAFRRDIESIRHAVTMLGMRWTRTWVNLVLLEGFVEKPRALITTAMVRARACERLARRLESERPEVFFTAGLLSTLDALLDRPMDEILEGLPLAPDLAGALRDRDGEIGQVLDGVLAYEASIWDRSRCLGLEPGDVRDAWIDALRFARDARVCLE